MHSENPLQDRNLATTSEGHGPLKATLAAGAREAANAETGKWIVLTGS